MTIRTMELNIRATLLIQNTNGCGTGTVVATTKSAITVQILVVQHTVNYTIVVEVERVTRFPVVSSEEMYHV